MKSAKFTYRGNFRAYGITRTSYARFDLPYTLESVFCVFYGLAQDVSEQQQNGS